MSRAMARLLRGEDMGWEILVKGEEASEIQERAGNGADLHGGVGGFFFLLLSFSFRAQKCTCKSSGHHDIQRKRERSISGGARNSTGFLS